MVSVDDPQTNREFAESLGADFPILSDPGKGVARAYGVVTAERELAYRWTYIIGPDGKVLAIDKEVTPNSAGQDLVAELTAAGRSTSVAGSQGNRRRTTPAGRHVRRGRLRRVRGGVSRPTGMGAVSTPPTTAPSPSMRTSSLKPRIRLAEPLAEA